MKVAKDALGNAAVARLFSLMDEGLGDRTPDIDAVEEAQFCLDILRQISQRKKRFYVDVVWPK